MPFGLSDSSSVCNPLLCRLSLCGCAILATKYFVKSFHELTVLSASLFHATKIVQRSFRFKYQSTVNTLMHVVLLLLHC